MSTKLSSTFKIVLIGDTGTGKTSIISKFHRNIFKDITQSTIGADFNDISYKSPDGHIIKLHLWDTAGQEKYRALVGLYFRGASVILFVFDLTNLTSLKNIQQWYDIYVRDTDLTMKDTPRLILVGNKSDAASAVKRSEVIDALISSYIKNYGFTYHETSAKTGENIGILFDDIKDKLCTDYDNKLKESDHTIVNTNELLSLEIYETGEKYYARRKCCLYQ